MKKIATVIVALATGFTGIAPAHAFPGVPAISTPQAMMPGVEQVRDHHRGHRYYKRHGWRHGHNRHWRHHGGYRYGRYYRRHHHNYAGAIIGGLAAGAIIGGLAQPRGYYGGNSHTSWCYSRYRSYRAYDNTYQPYYGRRRQCVSPY